AWGGARLHRRVDVAADEPRMIAELHDLDKRAIRAQAAQSQAVLDERVAILVRYLVAVSVPLAHLRNPVDLGSLAAACETARIRAESHGAAHVGHVLLRLHEADDGVLALRSELARVAVVEPEHVARKLDDRRLHSQADAEERESCLARRPDRLDHALHASHAKAARH